MEGVVNQSDKDKASLLMFVVKSGGWKDEFYDLTEE